MELILLILRHLTGSFAIYVSLIAFLGCLTLVRLNSKPRLPAEAPVLLKGYPIFGLLKFFSARPEVFRDGAAASRTGNFSFYFGKKRIIGLQGEEGRKTYFESRELDIAQGTNDLFICGPSISMGDGTVAFHMWAFRYLKLCLDKNSLVSRLPQWTSDTRAALRQFSSGGGKVINPFDDIFRIMYQLSMRTVGADEMAEDPALCSTTLSLFEQFERSMSPARIIFPWLPTPAWAWRIIIGSRLGFLIAGVVEKRKKKGDDRTDPVQGMIDQGLPTFKIAAFVIGAGFAGLNNSGINVAWLLCYLAEYPAWQNLVRVEIEAAVVKHRSTVDQDILDVLDTLAFDDWESEFPLLERCVREAVRLGTTGAAFRKNTSGHDVPIGKTGEIIPKDAYAVFLLDDVHMDPEVYSDPFEFDPDRYSPERAEHTKRPIGYYGWGAGRYPCMGARFAKVSMTVIIAHAVAACEWQVCDRVGNPTMQPMPRPDRSRHLANKPDTAVYLKCQPYSIQV